MQFTVKQSPHKPYKVAQQHAEPHMTWSHIFAYEQRFCYSPTLAGRLSKATPKVAACKKRWPASSSVSPSSWHAEKIFLHAPWLLFGLLFGSLWRWAAIAARSSSFTLTPKTEIQTKKNKSMTSVRNQHHVLHKISAIMEHTSWVPSSVVPIIKLFLSVASSENITCHAFTSVEKKTSCLGPVLSISQPNLESKTAIEASLLSLHDGVEASTKSSK